MERSDISGRDSVRVSVFFPARWRRIEDAEDLGLEIESHRTCDRFTTPPTAFSDLPSDLNDLTQFQEMSPQIYTLWMSLERKIDYLIRMINPKVFDDPSMEQCICIDLSAGGAHLRMEAHVKEEDKLLIRLTPPTFPLFILEAIVTVKMVEIDKENEGRSLIRVEFSSINLGDKEDLISYIFKRQREILRLKSE